MSITDWLSIGQKQERMENLAMEWDITQGKITKSVELELEKVKQKESFLKTEVFRVSCNQNVENIAESRMKYEIT